MNCRNSSSDVINLFHPDDDFSHTVKVFGGVGDENVGHGVIPHHGPTNIVQENQVWIK
jgi:hypothetical protein